MDQWNKTFKQWKNNESTNKELRIKCEKQTSIKNNQRKIDNAREMISISREKPKGNKTSEEIWNKRISASKSLDSKVIIKQKQISSCLLGLLFVFFFWLLFSLIPTQAHHPYQK